MEAFELDAIVAHNEGVESYKNPEGNAGYDEFAGSSLRASAPPVHERFDDLFEDNAALDFVPDLSPYHELPQELTAQMSGDPSTQNSHHHDHSHNNVAPYPQTPAFSPAALLNPKASQSKRPASSSGDGQQDQDPAFAGQVSLVERLHNVQERTASPAKRVKTDEAFSRKKAATSSNFGGSALNLQNTSSNGNGNGNIAPPPPPKEEAQVDLTMSDDDDMQVVGDNSNEVICIGKIKHCYIQSHYVPFPDPKKYLGNSGQQSRIKVSFRRAGGQQNNLCIMVVDPTGKEFGKVDMKTANGLCPLMDAGKVNKMNWMAWTEPRRKQANEGRPGSSFSGLIGLTLQLYCPRKFAHNIGKYLKAKNIPLIRPLFELQRFDYHNPQDGDSLTRVEAVHPSFVADQFSQQAHAPGAVGSSYVLRSVDEIRADVANVFDTVVSKSVEVTEREPSTHIKTELYPHQKQALYFMWDKEQDHTNKEHDNRQDSLWKPHHRDNGRPSYLHVITGQEVEVKPKGCRGGILADEMGLGKTLSILSLVADTDSIAAAQDFANKRPPPVPQGVPTIQPLINSKATLLVCPLSTMTNWKEQINEHFPPGSKLRWTRYHGSERFSMDHKELANYDIVITTYHIVAKDILDKKRALPHINWFRVVLDEAHTIRNPTQQSRATCMLPGQRRWAVTGTPVQNRLEDLGALFNFIQLAPFNTPQGFNQFVVSPFKNADPEVVPKLQLLVSTVTMRRTKEIIKDKVPVRNDIIVKLDFSPEERRLHDWFEKDTMRKVNIATSGDKMAGNTYARILTAILNMRLLCAHGRDLLSDNALKTTDGMTYDNPMEISEEDNEAPALSRQQAYEMLDLLDQTDNDDCAFCGGGPNKRSILEWDSDDEDDDGDVSDTIGYMTPCYHIVCTKHVKTLRKQWKDHFQPDGNTVCQICEDRNKPAAFEMKRSDYKNYQDERERMRLDPKLSKKVNAYTGPSTKTRALLHDLDQHRKWSDANPEQRPIKSVVFSCWTTHLDLIEIALKNHQHTYCRLDGRMSREKRDTSMRVFREDPSIHVMLVSIGAGGLGLNLTTANKVFMMEPQFNPAAEAQAVDRVHRLGQDREVMIKRFVMEKSFEEKMLELQQKKKDLADLTMSRQKMSKEEQTKQRLEELRSLFR